MTEHILAVDPGVQGAFAVVDMLGRLVATDDLPVVANMVSPALLVDIIEHWSPASVCIEKVSAMRGWGVTSSYRFGRAVGTIEGAVAALKVPVGYVSPGVWRRHFGLVGRDKELSRAKAIATWPDMASTSFRRRKDHGKAEASSIALWAVKVALASREERP